MNRTANLPASLQIPSIDGARAVSALIVFLSHVGLSRYVPGLFGVTVFFFLSGYLITTLLRLETERTDRVDFGIFYQKRVLRIFPPLYLVLFGSVILVMTGLLPGPLHPGALTSQVLFFTNYYEIDNGQYLIPGSEVLWSLAVEEHFYLLFPLSYVVLRRLVPKRHLQVAWLMAVCAVVLAWRCMLVFGLGALRGDALDDFHPRLDHATDARLDAILFGCALALYGNPALDPSRFSRRVWLGLAVPAGVAVLAVSFAVRSTGFRETLRYTLQALALIPLFIAAIRYPEWRPFRVLNLRPIRFLGTLSYTFYLTHSTAFALATRHLPSSGNLTQATVALALTLVVSVAMYYIVERPCSKLRSRLGKQPTPPAGFATPAAARLAAVTPGNVWSAGSGPAVAVPSVFTN
jgi:peptidoglycan/LPS O-acetylase OafA/YrhL